MIREKIKNIKLVLNLLRLRDFLHLMDMRLTYFLIPVFFSLGTAVFEGLSAALLVLLVKGVIKMDFNFAKGMPVFKTAFNILSRFFTISNSNIFILLVASIFAATLLKNVFSYFSSISVSFQIRQFSHNMRKLIFNRYLSFGKLFFDRSSEGYLHNLLIGFTNTIGHGIMGLRGAAESLFILLGYFILMFIISQKLTIFIIFFLPIFYYSSRWLIERIKMASEFYSDAGSALSRKISNILSCMSLVKAYSNEEKEKKEFARMSKDVARLEFSIDKKISLIYPLQEAIMLVVILLLISFVAFIVVKEKKEVAGFLVYFYLMKKAITTFGLLNKFKGTLATISGPMSQILKILSDKDKFCVADGDREFKGLKKSIEFNRLGFSYLKERQVLKDITFFIEKGMVTAIVGPTGTGKTTLINLILRFYDCPPSSILIDGIDIRQFKLKSLRQHISLVSQDTLLFNDTLRNNISYGLDRKISDAEVIEVTQKARLYDFVTALSEGFDTIIGDRGIRLSGGEKQRVSIARALLKGSEILILDEATSSLDTKTERLIQEAMDEVMKNRTVIIITHRLSTIRNADKIVFIEDGRLIEHGPLEEVLAKKGKFYWYWQEQKFH